MDHLWGLLTTGNVFLLGFLTWILFHVGCAAAQNCPVSHVWAERLGLVGFLAFVGLSLASQQMPSEGDLIVIVIRGLLAGWFAATIILIGLPMVLWLAAQARVRRLAVLAVTDARRRKREEERRIRQDETDRKVRQKERDRTAPERERAQREALELADLERQQKHGDQKRREDVRSHLELLYGLYAPKIQSRFTREMFADFVTKYMGDNRMPTDVEERGQQLQTMMEQHHQAVDPPPKRATLQDLATWFVSEKQRLESLPLDDMLKDEFRAVLHERYSELTQRFLQKLEP